MKNLVKKIALPGAILAFAMALFGGSAYAEDKLKSWVTSGALHLDETSKSVTILEKRINSLMNKKIDNEKKVSDFDAQIKTLTAEKKQLEAELQVSQQANNSAWAWGRKNNADKNAEINQKNAEINQKDTKIKQLDTEKSQLITDIKKLNAEKNELNTQIAELKATNTHHSEEKESTAGELADAIEHAKIVKQHAETAVRNTMAAKTEDE